MKTKTPPKPRVGRPPVPEDQKAKTLSITLTPSQFAWLDANRGEKSRNQHAAEQIPNSQDHPPQVG